MYNFEMVNLLKTNLQSRILLNREYSDFVSTQSVEQLLIEKVDSLYLSKDYADAWQIIILSTGELPTYKQVNKLQILSCIARDSRELYSSVQELMVEATGVAGLAPKTELIQGKNVIVIETSHILALNSGIQHVTRLIAKAFSSHPDFLLVATNSDGSGFTWLSQGELDHLLQESFTSPESDLKPNHEPHINLILEDCNILVPEVTKNLDFASRLRAIGAFTDNKTFFIGYDLIPILGPEYVSPVEIETFANYLLATSESTGIICISDQTRNEFNGYLKARETVADYNGKLLTLQLPVEPRIRLLSSEVPGEFKSLVGESYFLCVGTIEPRKNQLRVIAAFEELWARGLRNPIVFVGRIAPTSENEFKQSIHNQLGAIIFHYSDIPQSDLDWLYQNCLATIQVSSYEGFGLPVVESISHGKPVLVNPFGVQFELAEGNGGLPVDDISVSAIADSLEKIAKNSELRKELSDQALNAKFPTIDDYARGIVKILNSES